MPSLSMNSWNFCIRSSGYPLNHLSLPTCHNFNLSLCLYGTYERYLLIVRTILSAQSDNIAIVSLLAVCAPMAMASHLYFFFNIYASATLRKLPFWQMHKMRFLRFIIYLESILPFFQIFACLFVLARSDGKGVAQPFKCVKKFFNIILFNDYVEIVE